VSDEATQAKLQAGGSPRAFPRQPSVRIDCQWRGRDSLVSGSYLSDALRCTI
jgi:hypothetical protein